MLNELIKQLTPKELIKAEQFEQYLQSWVKKAEEKFIRGIIEHRGEPPINPEEEIEAEIMDILAYQHLKTKQK